MVAPRSLSLGCQRNSCPGMSNGDRHRRADLSQILDLLDAAVLSAGFDNSIGGRQVDGCLGQSIRRIGGDSRRVYGTVPTIVPETRQNSMSRANASQLARSGK